ncbi:MAG TPA: TonB family protein, partial [Rhodanobacteraceae bacterium]|nr:TonB family protein [Rhodanobacteraceae bacterium]
MLNALLLAAAFAAAPQTASDSLAVVLPEDRDAYWQIDKARTKAPRYPQRALRTRTSGCAAVAFVIEADGSVSRAWPVVETARSGFGNAAVKSIETWQFTPGSQNIA